tara:strand:+ start:211 stop:486 length:276 start_codon:yes stop_codon:yes gene_type:complete
LIVSHLENKKLQKTFSHQKHIFNLFDPLVFIVFVVTGNVYPHQKNIFAPLPTTASRTSRTSKSDEIFPEKSKKKRIYNRLTGSYLQRKTLN